MRPSPSLSLVILPACLLPGLALAQAAPPAQQPWQAWRPVAVYRGAEANVPPAVPVLRGSSAMGSPSPTVRAPQPAGPIAAVGGSRLWLVDPASGELVAYRLGGTTQVGVERVRCARRELP